MNVTRFLARNWLVSYAAVYMVLLYLPALLLPLFAFNSSTIIAFPLKGFTLEWFGVLIETKAVHKAVQNSLIIALITSAISTLLGILGARAIVRFRFPLKRGIVGLIMIPLILPEIIVGVSLLVLLMQIGISLSIWTVIAGHVLICLPFSVAILSSAFQGLDPSLEEASMDLGETRFGTFRRVIFPLILPGIISSMLITFTISLDEFIIAFFLTGTDVTLPVYIWGQMRFPAKLPSIMALGTILLLLSIFLLVLGELFRRRSARRQGKSTSPTGGLV